MQTLSYEMPETLCNHELSYIFLAELNEFLKEQHHVQIKLCFRRTIFIQPNLIAVLGLLIERCKQNDNQVILCNVRSKIIKLFESYQFINGAKPKKEHFMTYKKFKINHLQEFNLYLESTLSYIENTDYKVLIKNWMMELLNNSVKHANITSGQLYISGYINLSQDWMFVTVANIGASFYENVVSVCSNILDYERYESIKWGFEVGNSTSCDAGLGLSIIVSHLELIGGHLWCLSGEGYYDLKKKKGLTLPFDFNGTIMTLGIPLKRLI